MLILGNLFIWEGFDGRGNISQENKSEKTKNKIIYSLLSK